MTSALTTKLQPLMATLDSLPAITGEEMCGLTERLAELWQRANVAEDQQALDIIQAAWDRAHALSAAAVQTNVIATGIATVATEAVIAHDALAERIDELDQALASADEDHPMLRDFAREIREDQCENDREFMEEEAWPEALEEAYEAVWDDCRSTIVGLTGCNSGPARVFYRALVGGQHKWTDEQIALLRHLVTTFEVS